MEVAGFYFDNEFPHAYAVAYAKMLGCTCQQRTPPWGARAEDLRWHLSSLDDGAEAAQGIARPASWRGRSRATAPTRRWPCSTRRR